MTIKNKTYQEICVQVLQTNERNFEGNFFGGQARRRINRFNYCLLLILNMKLCGGQ